MQTKKTETTVSTKKAAKKGNAKKRRSSFEATLDRSLKQIKTSLLVLFKQAQKTTA